MNQCSHCGGSLHAKTLPYHDQLWGDETYRFENVPALACAACGEVFFEAHVSQAMDRVLQSEPKPTRICPCLFDHQNSKARAPLLLHPDIPRRPGGGGVSLVAVLRKGAVHRGS